MPNATLTVSTTIKATPDVVFAYLSDLTRHGEWAANPLRIEALTPGPVAVGSRYHSEAQVGRFAFSAELWVTVCQPPRIFTFAGKDETGQFEHRFTLSPQANETQVERRISFT